MKVFEILRNDITAVTEEQVAARLKRFNWKYEFSDNATVVTRGARELEELENMVYQLWKQNPERAVKLWNESAPGSCQTEPSFILRLKMQDGQ